MSYSKIIDPVVKVKNQEVDKLSDATSAVYGAGYIERKKYRYFWINTEDLQAEIDTIVSTEAGNGWAIEGKPTRVPVHDVIDDLFNAIIDLYRYVAS